MKNQKRIFLCGVFFLFLGTIILICREKIIISEYLSEHSIIEEIYFVPQEDNARKVKLYKYDDSDMFHAYITAAQGEEIKIYFNYCKNIILNNEVYSNGDKFPELPMDEPYLVQAIDWKGEVCAEAYITFYYLSDVSTIFITTNSGTMDEINDDKEHEESAYYAVYTQQTVLDSVGACTIKGRGNSTWGKEQKPYSVDLEDAKSILGMNAAADWALLCNYGDELPQLKNKVMFEIAQEMDVKFEPQGEVVNLYLNGQYNGLYLLAQRVSINDWYDNTSDTKQVRDAEFLLEFDERYEEEENYFLTEHQYVVIKDPKEVEQTQLSYIEDFVYNTERAIYNENGVNEETGKSYMDYLDMESWAQAFTLQNYFVQWDAEFASFYFYKPSQEDKLYAGPAWDFDMTCGKLYYGNYPRLSSHTLWIEDFKGKWLQNLVKHEEFQEYVRQAWIENYSPAISQVLTEDYSQIIDQFSPAIEMDKIRWNKKDSDFREKADELYNWLAERQTFLDDYYKNPEEYCAVTFEFPWGSIPYYVLKNTALEFLPCDEYGEYDKYTSRFGHEDIISWQNEEGEEVYADDIIGGNVTYYPIYK